MRDTLGRALSLGLGLAMAGKEQVEKTIEELVRKGEVSRAESKDLVDDLVKRGDELKDQIESATRERVQAVMKEGGMATREEVARLEQRIEELERKLNTEH
ncbi:phasin family protein [Paenibacillus daejeonensis]|uniref:phasin family protein n=1 Tax=Paenibacillus daejeonensis TaxID=135193 RepID=UPI00037844EC|nr:phasin family protein [Paenibacillus daejeonensis]